MAQLNIQNFLKQLIDIESITGNEKEVALFLKKFLTELGLKVQLYPVDSDRYNLFAAETDKPQIILTSHMDTVAPFFPARETDGVIFGRGACDAKGQIAAMIYTFIQLKENIRMRTGLLFVIAEETNSIGAKTVNKMGLKPDYFINGEPTGNKLVHAQRGVFFFEAIAKGTASHSGYPEYGSSAIDLLIEFIAKIRSHKWPTDEIFGKTSFNVGKISGGEAINTLASSARAECGFRIATSIEQIEEELIRLKPGGIEINPISKSPALNLYVPQQIKDSINVGYGSDVHFLQKTAPTLMIGPGSILDAHKLDEHVTINELNEAVKCYTELIDILINNKNLS